VKKAKQDSLKVEDYDEDKRDSLNKIDSYQYYGQDDDDDGMQ
jgi:hypothetical protein